MREIFPQAVAYGVESCNSAGCLQVFRVHEEKLAILRCDSDYPKVNI